ncbi:MAG: 16S rRNA (cytidine(1402)-2'-O)-methyltransferase [Lachnospiraceae bacterium]|nr:16S rRNA (cytidine(1402)-2'-O)-methyltransferase [Lachnospiraceae bacterium]
MNGNLYIVATPIGNLSDMTERAIETLKSVDLIAAEDTRNTGNLLNHFDIHTPMKANHKFNEKESVDYLLMQLQSGKNIAVVSDAGTPCVNDPGFVIASAASKAGINVIPVPGACAAVTAVSASGLPSSTFTFMGFFPREKKETEALLDYIKDNRDELYIFYESPLRIKDTMEIIGTTYPDAQICLCNDLTKLHERIYRGTPDEVLNELKLNPNATKGEYCLLVYVTKPQKEEDDNDLLSPEAYLIDEIVKNGVTMKDAVSTLASNKQVPYSKKELYTASLKLKELL